MCSASEWTADIAKRHFSQNWHLLDSSCAAASLLPVQLPLIVSSILSSSSLGHHLALKVSELRLHIHLHQRTEICLGIVIVI